MKLRDFLELYNGAGTICINDDNLNCICKETSGTRNSTTLRIAKSLPSASMITNFV